MAAMTVTSCQVDGDLIRPDMIPGDDIDPPAIAGSATGFSTAGTAVTEKGAAVVTQWAALSGVYVAPESPELLDVMNPVSVDSAALGQTFTAVSKIIADFADQVAPLKTRLAAIREEARAFVARVSGGVTVDIWDGDHPAYEAGMLSFMVTDFSDMGPQTISWREHKPSVQENADLIQRVNAEAAALDQVRADCVNAINGLRTDQCVVGVVPYTAADLNAEGVTLPWGAATEGDRSCSESTDAAIVDFGKGFGGAVVGSVEGLGALFSYNAATGNWGDGDMAGKAWSGLGMLGAGLVLAGPVSIAVGLVPQKNVPEWLHGTQDFINGSQEQLLAGVKGMVASDQWAENPAGALGATTFNIGSFFIPGAGVAAGGAKVASIGGKAGLVVAHVAEVVLPGVNVASRGAMSLTLHAGQGLTVLGDAAKLNIAGGASIGRASLAQAMHSLADQIPTVRIEPGFAAITPDAAVFGAPPRLAIGDPGSGGHTLHTLADPPHVDTPVSPAANHVDTPATTPGQVADTPAGGTHGATPDGATPAGATPDGATPAGATPDGATPAGATPDGAAPAGATPDGSAPAEHAPDASTPPAAHVPPHSDLLAPPPGAAAVTPAVPDLSAIDAKYRIGGTGDIAAGQLDAWAAEVSAAYPTLSKSEVIGVHDYTTGSYTEMNGYLRDLGHTPDVPALEARIDATTAGLSKLPPVDATSWRGVTSFPGFLDGFVVGKPWSDPAFVSSSIDSTKAFPGDVVFTIHGRTGVDVNPFSAFKHEVEILFQRGAEFEVLNKQQVAGKWQIDLREIVK
ncbi:ADP-ribosyltransferase [Cryobacterium sp. PH29-G1]|uniref:ADP-ribosyltransferase n=1 Tax=Cryobacterium sp. PH29-G1 TaxID=3046211 RepID=UPI0024B94139|nr:ADP-ribosyltransferase [Cryobacterium sp. PH29-G1]MDJ0350045.1 ADP-ribosyltransferase [Cryobacterium sp. PH29-G1]